MDDLELRPSVAAELSEELETDLRLTPVKAQQVLEVVGLVQFQGKNTSETRNGFQNPVLWSLFSTKVLKLDVLGLWMSRVSTVSTLLLPGRSLGHRARRTMIFSSCVPRRTFQSSWSWIGVPVHIHGSPEGH